jgi:hypothetical protein
VAQADLMIIFVRVLGNAVVEGCNSMALGFSLELDLGFALWFCFWALRLRCCVVRDVM